MSGKWLLSLPSEKYFERKVKEVLRTRLDMALFKHIAIKSIQKEAGYAS